jgi:hypothetical protein
MKEKIKVMIIKAFKIFSFCFESGISQPVFKLCCRLDRRRILVISKGEGRDISLHHPSENCSETYAIH